MDWCFVIDKSLKDYYFFVLTPSSEIAVEFGRGTFPTLTISILYDSILTIDLSESPAS